MTGPENKSRGTVRNFVTLVKDKVERPKWLLGGKKCFLEYLAFVNREVPRRHVACRCSSAFILFLDFWHGSLLSVVYRFLLESPSLRRSSPLLADVFVSL